MIRPAPLFAIIAAMLIAMPVRADAPGMFGSSPASMASARANLAAGDGSEARENPALAADPGFRLRIGYGYESLNLHLDGDDAGVPNASGLDLAGQFGARVADDIDLGVALSLHFPDRYLARIGFRPATEPQFVLYESPLERTSVDVVGAIRYRFLSVGVGIASELEVGGGGTDFSLGQDARGTNVDAKLDVTLPYRFTAVAGVRAAFDRAQIAIAFRGPMAIDLEQHSVDRVNLTTSPLNGVTIVNVTGTSGYDPAVLDVGGRLSAGGLSASFSAEYAFYSFTPPPVADVDLDVHLGTTPSQRAARFPAPRFRDVIIGRVGVEAKPVIRRKDGEPDDWRWAIRAGYAYLPSPVPSQTGFTTYLDANRHVIAAGGGLHIGKVLGVDLAIDAAAQLHALVTRTTTKSSPALPYAQHSAGGWILAGSGALEGTWR